jgi:hypothetical protein
LLKGKPGDSSSVRNCSLSLLLPSRQTNGQKPATEGIPDQDQMPEAEQKVEKTKNRKYCLSEFSGIQYTELSASATLSKQKLLLNLETKCFPSTYVSNGVNVP